MLRAIMVSSLVENSWPHAVQRSRSLCLCFPGYDRWTMLPVPRSLHRATVDLGTKIEYISPALASSVS